LIPAASLDRRAFLASAANGFGALACTQMLARDGLLGVPRRDLNGGLHHRAKVRRIVHLFMNGGASPMDTFDHKPELERRHGETFDPGGRVEAATSVPGTILKSPFGWQQHGQCGRWVSSVLPHLAGCVDDLAFVMAMVSKTNVHGPGVYLQSTGFVNPGFPSIGSWVSFALGSMNDDLPTFVVIPDARGLPYNSKGSFSSGFLPVAHQGVLLRPSQPEPLADLFPPATAAQVTPASESDGRALLAQLDRAYLQSRPGDSRLGCAATNSPRACSSARRQPSTSPARARRRSGCTAWTRTRRATSAAAASSPAACSSATCVSCSCGAAPPARPATGTTTPTSRRSCRSSPAASTGRSPACCWI
jgi:hypothetical protein